MGDFPGFELVQNGAIGAFVAMALFGQVDEGPANAVEFADPLLELTDVFFGELFHFGAGTAFVLP